MKNLKDTVKAIIWDMDGTLFQYKSPDGKYKGSNKQKLIEIKKREIIKKFDVKADEETLKFVIDLSKKSGIDSSEFLSKYYNQNIELIKTLKMDLPVKEILSYSVETKKIIKDLSKKYILFIVTGSPKIWSDKVMKELRIGMYFKNIYNDCYYPILKQEKYANIANEYKFEKSEIVVVGDSFELDIKSALDIGIYGIHTQRINLLKNIEEFL